MSPTRLPEVPSRYPKCFDRTVSIPEPGTDGWTVEEATAIIANLIADKKITRQCGRDLIEWANRNTAIVNEGRP